MNTGWRQHLIIGTCITALVLSLAACGGGTVTVTVTPTQVATATIAPTATNTAIPATPTPAPGVCDPSLIAAAKSGGPDEGFQYPPLTHFAYDDSGAGNNYYTLCSSGTPTSILAFLQSSIPAGGWKITGTTTTTLGALGMSKAQDGFCPSVNITVGAHAGYPGEWDADFHPPATSC